MIVGNEIKTLALVLKADMVLDGPEIVAQVQTPARLDAGQITDGLSCWFRCQSALAGLILRVLRGNEATK